MADKYVTVEQKEEMDRLKKQLQPFLEKPKCYWPLDTMKNIHRATREIKKTCAAALYNLMEWPLSRFCHKDGFYKGDHNVDPKFTRSKDWFTDQNFKKYSTTYTYSNAWDRLPLNVTIYVPDTVQEGTKAPIMWFFHGGGFCTGANDHIPWYSATSINNARANRAIIIAPDYPLGPEANYVDIVESIQDFLWFYKNNTCFEPGYQGMKWTHWLLDQISVKGVTLDTERVFVEGESAGGNAAVVALFLNADKVTGTKIPICAALLRYPMLAHYKRSFDKPTIGYMNEERTKEEVFEQVRLILNERDKLQAMGYLPTRGNSSAPENMAPAFLMSVTHSWQLSFQRVKPGQSIVSDPFANKDCIERAMESIGRIDASFLPAMFIYHGDIDSNCPLDDTKQFMKVLRENYPTAYAGDRLVLEIVVGEGHGFDYEKSEEEVYMMEAYGFVDKHWLGV
ncbi:hypothetical protein HBI82_018170 [Parastagonospora nodorum]|nr:hypothetical protein HBI82_018170 [Parastagonospora nodorum]